MKFTFFLSLTFTAVFFISCDNDENDDNEEIKHQQICDNLFITDSIPTKVTEPYITIIDYFDFSLIDTTNYLIYRSLYCPETQCTTSFAGDNKFSTCIEGLYNHTTYTYQPSIETWQDYYKNKHWYECKGASFTVDIDEEALAVTEDMTDSLTTNSVTLSGHFNISPEHASNYSYFIYTSTTPDIPIRDGIIYNTNGHKLSLDNEYNGTVNLSKLLFNTTYYYQACVRHVVDAMSYGATYRGAVKSFTTPPLDVTVNVCDFTNKVPVGPVAITYEVHGNNVPDQSLTSGICYSASNTEPTLDGPDCFDGDQFGYHETTILGLAPNTMYYYRAYAQHPYSTEIAYSDVKTFETEDVYVSPEATDLGLSVIWAGCNVGATSPEQYGNYYNHGGKGCTSSCASIDSIQYLDGWRLPTWDECYELISRCNYYWINYKGSLGYLVESTNGATIFLPASSILGEKFSTTNGGYWASDPKYGIGLYKGALYTRQYFEEAYLSIRLVHDK